MSIEKNKLCKISSKSIGDDGVCVVPENVEIIGEEAFAGISNLKEVVLPKSLKKIEGRAFLNCKKLVRINIPDYANKIGENVFEMCESIEEVNIPASLTFLSKNSPIFYKWEMNC